ncbi:peptidase [Nocardioides piscis]|uniref:Peptidase n=1 Tax=Nocardioides piscis TaxID=2714938 RepID=A0A6G7YEQ9_9ACTN|nr:peptidase [Nocardioides piscis]QIK75097.1 peptidase [Nocardioides piscis]
MHTSPRRSIRRLVAAALVASALVATALVLPDSVAPATGALRTSLEAGSTPALADDGHDHDHGDPESKNAISRGGTVSAATEDPTSRREARDAAAYVASQRRLRDPRLTTVPVRPKRTRTPANRYAMAGGCYTLLRGGEPVRFRATRLGSYLLIDRDRAFLAADGSRSAQPSPSTEWVATQAGRRMRLTAQGRALTVDDKSSFRLRVARGCPGYAESQVGVKGRPHAGVTPFQEVRGYVDAHTHGMAFEFLGGAVHCGRPWHPYGPELALVDCPDHSATDGYGAALETALGGKPGHDPVGWPTFKDWPAPESLTHEGTYYKWLERSWRAGQRIFVNLLVENNKLCELYPLKKNSCDDMDSLRLQAKRMYELQDYIDAQAGGPGRGWYRIVRSPWQARRVINAGKLAVVMGIETSVPFGCTYKKVPTGDVNQCDPAGIDQQLDEMHELGVRQMELVNKFDNALSGVAGDNGETGVVVNAANFLETASYWDMRHCEPADGESADKTQLAAPDISAGQQDALFGAVGQVSGLLNLAALPLYGTPMHCNTRGLTGLGAHLVDRLADKHMLIDPDHMSVKARDALLDRLEARRYPGALSSHSWSTPDAYPRIYALGGYVAPYAGDSTGFVAKWRRHLGWADERYYFGFGYGADINGLGAQGNPRGADVPNPVSYPFTGFNGVKVAKQRAGQRVYDLNIDGVAQYGLYPDWIEDISKVAGAEGDAIKDDMLRGAEAYLQTWERAEGVAADSCRNPGLRKKVSRFLRLARPGTSTKRLLFRVGQPYERLGDTFTYCARTGGDRKVVLRVELGRSGRVVDVRRR